MNVIGLPNISTISVIISELECNLINMVGHQDGNDDIDSKLPHTSAILDNKH